MFRAIRTMRHFTTAVYEGLPWNCGCGAPQNPADATNCAGCGAAWGSTS
ncbi:hypothetical protein [Streptomyces sp. NPDC088348]